MSQSSTISKITHENEPQTKTNAVEDDKEEKEQRPEEDSHRPEQQTPFTTPLHTIATVSPHSFAAIEASLPSFDTYSMNEGKDTWSPQLIPPLRSNNNNQKNQLSLLQRFQQHHYATTNTKAFGNNSRSDLSAITLDTALEQSSVPITPVITATTQPLQDVPLLVLKDMTTVFSSLAIPDTPTTNATGMRRASLSAASPSSSQEQQLQKLKLQQQRRASVAGGEPCGLDSSLSNARQPRRLLECSETIVPRKIDNTLIMPQRRSSSPRPFSHNKTLLPFVSSRPSLHKKKPDPYARSPTDRDKRFLTNFFDRKKLEPTGRSATGAGSMCFSRQSIVHSPMASLKKSVHSSTPPVSSPSSSSKQSLSSGEMMVNAPKRSRALRPQIQTAPLADTTLGKTSKSTIIKGAPSPRHIRPVDSITNNAMISASMEKESAFETTKEPIMEKQSSSRRILRSANDVGISSSTLEKTFISQSAAKKQSGPSPRRIRTDSRKSGNPPENSRPRSEPDHKKDALRDQSIFWKNGERKSSPARSPRKNPSKSTIPPVATVSPKSALKTTTVETETSPSSVKKRIRSPQGKQPKGRSSSMSHLPILASSRQASSRIINGLPNAQEPVEDLAGGALLCSNVEQSKVRRIEDRENSSGRADTGHPSPYRPSRTNRIASSDPSKMGKHENGGRRLTIKSKQRASSMGHAPIARKYDFAENEQQSDPASSNGLSRMSGLKATKSSEGPLPKKILSSPRRRRRRVASMQHVSSTTLNGTAIRPSEAKTSSSSVAGYRRAMSMQHVPNSAAETTCTVAKKITKMESLNFDSEEAPVNRQQEQRSRRLRRCSLYDVMQNTGYDSAPESETIPLDPNDGSEKTEPRYARSRSTGFNSNFVISDLTRFASAAESKLEGSKVSGSKPNDFFGVATGFFRRIEKKSAPSDCDEGSFSYAKADSFLLERYRPTPT